MKENEKIRLPFEDWQRDYFPICCLKRSEERETWLLQKKDEEARYILKRGEGDSAMLLETEYSVLQKLPKGTEITDFLPVFRREKESGFLLRRYVEGLTLKRLAEQEGIMSAEETARIGIKLCRNIAFLHHQNPPVIHRDIKPENVVLTNAGHIRLIDFETSRYYKEEGKEDTIPLGTKGYAAPEQFGFGQTDERTDIYAVGKVLLYLWRGEISEEEWEQPEKGKDRTLKKVLMKCCSFRPEDRYQQIEEVEQELKRVEEYAAGRRSKQLILEAVCLGLLVLTVFLGIRLWQAEKISVSPVCGRKQDIPMKRDGILKILSRMWTRYCRRL